MLHVRKTPSVREKIAAFTELYTRKLEEKPHEESAKPQGINHVGRGAEELILLRSDLTSQITKLSDDVKLFQHNTNE